MASSTPLLKAFESRRTIYPLSSASPISEARIREICTHTMLHTPSAFNTQGARLQLLLGPAHHRFWDLAEAFVRANIPEAMHPHLLGRIAGYRAGAGTACFWDDPAPLAKVGEGNPIIKPLLPEWTEHSQGMHHYALWTALEAEGLGANLQHYSMLEDAARKEWSVPETWKLKAQLVFGTPTGAPNEKTFQEVEGSRFVVHGVLTE